jgi:hypothetical protein
MKKYYDKQNYISNDTYNISTNAYIQTINYKEMANVIVIFKILRNLLVKKLIRKISIEKID